MIDIASAGVNMSINYAGNWTNKLREVLTALYSHYGFNVMTHVKEEHETTGVRKTTTPDIELEHETAEEEEQPQGSEQTELVRKEDTEEDNDGKTMDAEGYDTAEEGEVGELSSTLLSYVTNLQPSASFTMISPINSPLKKPKNKTTKRKRSDYLFDSYTPIAVRKHKHN